MKKINFEMNEFVELDCAVTTAIGRMEVAYIFDFDDRDKKVSIRNLKVKIKKEYVAPHESEMRTLELTDDEVEEAGKALRAYISETEVKNWYVENGFVKSAEEALKKIEA